MSGVGVSGCRELEVGGSITPNLRETYFFLAAPGAEVRTLTSDACLVAPMS